MNTKEKNYKKRPSSETKGVFSFKNFWKNFVFIGYEICD